MGRKILAIIILIAGWKLTDHMYSDGHWVFPTIIRVFLVLYAFCALFSDADTKTTKTTNTTNTTSSKPAAKTIATSQNTGTYTPRLTIAPAPAGSIPHISTSTRPNMHGTPGAGLSSQTFGEERASMGTEGEQKLADILAYYQVDRYAQVFYSLRIPNYENIDVDCAVLTSRDLYLIDAKLWKKADRQAVFARLTPDNGYGAKLLLRDYDPTTGLPTGPILAEYELRKTMTMAAPEYRKLVPNITVHTVTVVCPNSSGTAGIMSDAKTADGNLLHQAEDYVRSTILPSAQQHPLTTVNANARRIMNLLKANVE